jgi:hypothetical protein
MVLPVVLSLGCLTLIFLLYKKHLTIPTTMWEFLVFGREYKEIPVRRSKRDKFPAPIKDLALAYGPVQPGSATQALIITGSSIHSLMQNNATLEVPVEDKEVPSSDNSGSNNTV